MSIIEGGISWTTKLWTLWSNYKSAVGWLFYIQRSLLENNDVWVLHIFYKLHVWEL